MTHEFEDLVKDYFEMSSHAKRSIQKAFLIRLIVLKDELNEDTLELYTLWDVLDLIEVEAVGLQKFEVAQIIKDIRDRAKED